MVKVTVRLPRETHARVRTRAFAEGVSMDELGRRFFEGYANGGLAAGEPERERQTVALPSQESGGHPPSAAASPAPAASPAFKPDPKKGK